MRNRALDRHDMAPGRLKSCDQLHTVSLLGPTIRVPHAPPGGRQLSGRVRSCEPSRQLHRPSRLARDERHEPTAILFTDRGCRRCASPSADTCCGDGEPKPVSGCSRRTIVWRNPCGRPPRFDPGQRLWKRELRRSAKHHPYDLQRGWAEPHGPRLALRWPFSGRRDLPQGCSADHRGLIAAAQRAASQRRAN
jgi:hypothetical protein